MRKWIVVALLSSLLLGPSAVRGQQNRPTLTPADYADIERLNAYWVHGADMGDNTIRMRAFVPGGVLRQPAGVGDCAQSVTDCDSIQRPLDAALPQTPAIAAKPYAKLPGCRVSKTPGCLRQHYITDTLIEPTIEGAKGLSHLLVMEKDPGQAPVLTTESGAYIDWYVKGPDGWGIKIKEWFPFRETGNPYVR